MIRRSDGAGLPGARSHLSQRAFATASRSAFLGTERRGRPVTARRPVHGVDIHARVRKAMSHRILRAEVVSVGTELLLGETVDTNSAWLSARLADAGYDVYWSSRVGDNLERVVAALERALGRSDIVLTTGGLGSTDDDLTREAVARIAGEPMFVDAVLEADLRRGYRDVGLPFSDLTLRQAQRIASAEALPNRVGTAPGWFVRLPEGRIIATLPGPPRELQAMYDAQLAPRLPSSGSVLHRHTFKTHGLGEGRVFEMLGDWMRSANPSVATYARPDGVHVRIACQASDEASAVARAAPAVDAVRAILGTAVWGVNDDTLAARVAEALRLQGGRLATVESLTGGQVAQIITAVAGVSDVYVGGVVAYDPQVKVRLGVDIDVIGEHGVVSAQTAEAMARACASWFGCTHAVATTGVAGPSPLEDKAPGTAFVAAHSPLGTQVRALRLRAGSRAQVQERAAYAALTLLWEALSPGVGAGR
ncbi:MAG: CinA family nicotinamide mononucleotide deamidase-related protein [Proteobacteria bacterium]|nr:CinA family nicotinamide mononucleotide deamidase-related protein [Pseudomonadota bacterium]